MILQNTFLSIIFHTFYCVKFTPLSSLMSIRELQKWRASKLRAGELQKRHHSKRVKPLDRIIYFIYS